VLQLPRRQADRQLDLAPIGRDGLHPHAKKPDPFSPQEANQSQEESLLSQGFHREHELAVPLR
jgi:hypothetical protein